MEEDYKRRVLSLIMDISFSVLLILFCFYTFIFGNVSLIAIVLRILIVSMGIYIPYNKYVKKKINGIVYFIFLFLGVVIAIGCLRGNEVFNYSECYQIIFQYLTGFICIIIILRIIYYVKKKLDGDKIFWRISYYRFYRSIYIRDDGEYNYHRRNIFIRNNTYVCIR